MERFGSRTTQRPHPVAPRAGASCWQPPRTATRLALPSTSSTAFTGGEGPARGPILHRDLLDEHHGRIATVLGPRDRERSQAGLPLPNDWAFIVHPGLPRGKSVPLRDPAPATIRSGLGIALDGEGVSNSGQLRYMTPLRVDAYRDPVPGFDGAWSAVFATTDESGYIVAVQSRRDTTALTRVLLEKLALPAGIPFALGLLGLGSIALTRRRRCALNSLL